MTRIIRLGYFEHPSYVPLLHRTYEKWRDLESKSGVRLVNVTGIAEIGPPDSVLVEGTLASSRLHDLRHEVLDARALMRRFPAFRLPPEFVGIVQPDGGFIEAAAAIETHLALAQEAGAERRLGETVIAVEPRGAGVRITTDRGTIEAGCAILAAGPWTGALLADFRLPLRVTRQVLAWFEPLDPAPFAPGRFPVFLLETRHGIHYGFPPHVEPGIKLAKHHHADETVDIDTVDRKVSRTDENLVRSAIAEYLPAANGRLLAAKTCLYTMTPDGDFLIDRLAGAPQIVIASPCSGHGFKFAPVIGEILADLAQNGATPHDISRFAMARFAATGV
jgi:sarcosine oxidase